MSLWATGTRGWLKRVLFPPESTPGKTFNNETSDFLVRARRTTRTKGRTGNQGRKKEKQPKVCVDGRGGPRRGLKEEGRTGVERTRTRTGTEGGIM